MLRKQNSHVSFLHLYHHSLMAFSGYVGTRFIPGGQATLLVLINCFVHVFMYAYYLSSSLNLSAVWVQWSKRHITHLQLVSIISENQIRLLFFHACMHSARKRRFSSQCWRYISSVRLSTKTVSIQRG